MSDIDESLAVLAVQTMEQYEQNIIEVFASYDSANGSVPNLVEKRFPLLTVSLLDQATSSNTQMLDGIRATRRICAASPVRAALRKQLLAL